MNKQLSFYNQSKSVLRDFERELEKLLLDTGIFFRLFSRLKQEDSINAKISRKREEKGTSYKMQDYIGFRIVLYFKDDIKLVEKILANNFQEINKTVDSPKENEFSPIRINHVFSLPQKYEYLIPSLLKDKIDCSFEVQIRTIFSEGWHEVEHDFRYKCKKDWDNYKEFSRILNGLFATLENCDWAIIKLFDDLSYQNYKNKEWANMLKNKFRLRFDNNILSTRIEEILNSNKQTAKKLFKANRFKIIEDFSSEKIPFSFDNIVYYIFLCEQITENIEPPILIKELYEKKNNLS